MEPGSYEQQLGEYVAIRGRAPQSVTMHPETANALGLDEGTVDPALTSSIPLVVTSPDYRTATRSRCTSNGAIFRNP